MADKTTTRNPVIRVHLDHDEILVDNFAGGGGASSGVELALGRSPDIAINRAYGIEICAPVECPVCGQRIASRPDGSPRNHSVWVNTMYPRLGTVACPGGKRVK